ncbi:UDP-glucose 4-epimerase GalE [Hoeflea sp. WL0058]|uniref:UDP-glucose 4-epimerase n=1 Tax=Flavimaribacter sediminis TaxID=2865987 RepID=A0AAE3D2Z1_9HYPH|nr:UDP-glucose 4-epimerase GalE [Flavimaribacter sediminis]MBW8639336.1 UDP-glucose 4-epimerase GalE [Flavimaribacter sediminis]
MSVLVTGGAGYIGSHMVWRLLDAGEEVTVIDCLSTGHDWAVPPEANLVVADIGDQESVQPVLKERGVDAVIHFAGSIIVPESVSDPLGYYLNNTVKSRALLEACVNCGVKHFIFSSTAAVYGTPERAPVSEDADLHPESPYGNSKLMTELMLRDASAAHGFSYAVLRYFNVAGADSKGRAGQSTRNATHLIKVATQAALGKRDGMEVYGQDYPTPDGTCIRDYIHVSDLVEAHYLALEHLRAGGGNLVANCGYGQGYSVLEVIDAVKKVSGVDFAVREADRRPGDPATIVADPAKIKAQLGWTPRHDDLSEIVRDALDWERSLERRNTQQ